MAKISFWKVLGVVGTISAELTEAMEDENTPGKIDAKEAIIIAHKLIIALDLDLGEHEVYLDMIIAALDQLPDIVDDNKISAREILYIAEYLCTMHGFDLDKEGIEF
jgi:hypothetical protein